MPRTGDRRPGPGLRVLAKFVENGVCVVRSRAGRRPRRSRPGRPDRDEQGGRRARRAARDGDRGHRVRPGAGATLRRGAARVCVIAAGTNDSTATGSSRRGGTPGAASGTERTERAWPDSSAISTPPGRRASAHQEHHRDAGGGGAGELLNADGPLQRGRRRLQRSPPKPGRSPPSASPRPCLRRSPPRTAGSAGQDLAAKVAPGTLLGLGREAEGHRPRGAARCDRPSPQLRTDAGPLDRCGEDAAPKVTRGNLAQQC